MCKCRASSYYYSPISVSVWTGTYLPKLVSLANWIASDTPFSLKILSWLIGKCQFLLLSPGLCVPASSQPYLSLPSPILRATAGKLPLFSHTWFICRAFTELSVFVHVNIAYYRVQVCGGHRWCWLNWFFEHHVVAHLIQVTISVFWWWLTIHILGGDRQLVARQTCFKGGCMNRAVSPASLIRI